MSQNAQDQPSVFAMIRQAADAANAAGLKGDALNAAVFNAVATSAGYDAISDTEQRAARLNSLAESLSLVRTHGPKAEEVAHFAKMDLSKPLGLPSKHARNFHPWGDEGELSQARRQESERESQAAANPFAGFDISKPYGVR